MFEIVLCMLRHQYVSLRITENMTGRGRGLDFSGELHCVSKTHQLWRVLLDSLYNVKIHAIFGVQFESRLLDKKQTYLKTEA